jgi:hypothetical protein
MVGHQKKERKEQWQRIGEVGAQPFAFPTVAVHASKLLGIGPSRIDPDVNPDLKNIS